MKRFLVVFSYSLICFSTSFSILESQGFVYSHPQSSTFLATDKTQSNNQTLLERTQTSQLSPLLDKTGTLWSPYLEWSIENTSFSGNPFDLVASVTFSHQGSNASHTTEMFYDGNNTWKWRFSGTKTGTWNFSSSSDDPELDGLSGTVTINPNPDPDTYGFITEYQSDTHTKWARFKGNNEDIEAFVPQFVMYNNDVAAFYNDEQAIEASIDLFFGEHGFNGVHIPNMGGRWFNLNGTEIIENSYSDPDRRTFEALELLITKVHAAGGVVHIWPWGDVERRWSSSTISGGANGTIDKRLQRYIAARLGPLPGWSMGYGFDLFEWTTRQMLEEWHNYMHDRMGWHHYLGGRADKNQLNQLYEGFDYASYEWHEPGYNDYIDHSTRRPQQTRFLRRSLPPGGQWKLKKLYHGADEKRTLSFGLRRRGGQHLGQPHPS